MAVLSSPTLQNLITETRIILNQRDPDNSLWKDDELTNYLNEGVRIYFTEAQAVNEGYFTVQVDIDITNNSETVPLPVDCFKVRALYKKVNDGFTLCPYRNNLTEGYSTQGGNSLNNYIPFYYFRDNNIVLRPLPNFGEVGGLRLEYIAFPDNMIWGGDSMTDSVSPIFKQLIVMYAVYKAKFKESLVSGGMMHKLAEEHLGALYQNFKNAISERSKNPTYIIPYNPETEGF